MDARSVPVWAREKRIGAVALLALGEPCARAAGWALNCRAAVLHPIRRPAIALLLLVLLAILPPVAAQGPVERVVITAVDSTNFPAITLRFRALDAAGRHAPGIQRNQVGIQDGETAATAESLLEENAPLAVHFVIETGVSLDQAGWGAALAAVRAFSEGGWMDGEATQVAVSYVRGRALVPLIAPTSDAGAIANLDSPNPSESQLAVAMPALTGLLEEMARQSPGQAQVIVFITRQLESNIGHDALVARSRETGIPIYTALLRSVVRPNVPGSSGGTPTPPPLDELIEGLAADTGGVFTLMAEDPARLVDAYGDLAARGRQYAVVYRVGDDAPGTRNVTLSLPGAAGAVSASTSYDIAIEPPRVVIRTPENGTIIIRQVQEADGDPAQAEPTTQDVIATVHFGLNPERRVHRATLLVDDAEADHIELPPRGDSEELTINLSWDMRNVAVLGETSHTLVVEVEDELGLTDSASAEVTVRIADVPRQPVVTESGESGSSDTDDPTVDNDPPYEVEDCYLEGTLCSRIELPIRNNPVAAISLLVALLALLLAALMWINRGKAPVQRMTETVRRGFDRITNRYRRSEVRAYLELLAGDGDVGHRYEIYGDTPIGRSRQNAELLFQTEAENSPISRLHCTITDEEDHFMIRDEDSANGTYLNGERLTPIVPHRLKDGDILELARVERGGVRLRFVAATAEDTVPPPNNGYTVVDSQLGSQPDGRPVDQTRGRF